MSKVKTITIRLPEQVDKDLKAYCEDQQVARHKFIVTAIQAALYGHRQVNIVKDGQVEQIIKALSQVEIGFDKEQIDECVKSLNLAGQQLGN